MDYSIRIDRHLIRAAGGSVRHALVSVIAPQALGWSYAADRAHKAQPREVFVDREVARLCAARARADALELNREGKYKEARAVLGKTARRIDAYAGGDAELKAIADGLRGDGAGQKPAASARPRWLWMVMLGSAVGAGTGMPCSRRRATCSSMPTRAFSTQSWMDVPTPVNPGRSGA